MTVSNSSPASASGSGSGRSLWKGSLHGRVTTLWDLQQSRFRIKGIWSGCFSLWRSGGFVGHGPPVSFLVVRVPILLSRLCSRLPVLHSFACLWLVPPLVILYQVLRVIARHISCVLVLAVSASHVRLSLADWGSPSSCDWLSGLRLGVTSFGGV